jgi:LysM repeat protein
MKFTSLFGIILLAHAGLIGVLLIQPGCQSRRAPTTPAPAPPAMGDATTQPTPAPTRALDPAFNAGLPRADGRLTEPTRPPSTPSPAALPMRDDALLQPLVDSRSYTVVAGDSLSQIARREKVTLAELLAANNLSRDATIYVGQTLVIPAAATAAADAADAMLAPAPARGTDYVVRSGDTLSGIAKRHGVTVAQIKAVNNLSRDTIFAGQTLIIPDTGEGDADRPPPPPPPPSAATAPAPGAGTGTYTVAPGDTPIRIARKFKVDAAELMRINNITDPRRLYVGQVLRLPAGATGAPPATSPTQQPAAGRTTATLVDRTSQPQVIEAPPAPSGQPLSDLEALEAAELPFVEVLNVEEPDPNPNP